MKGAAEVKKLIRAIGSYMTVAVLCGVSESAVKRWAYKGYIPEQHWKKFLRHPACGNLSTEKLHLLNERARQGGRK